MSENFVTSFFPKNNIPDTHLQYTDEFTWLISADNIFESEIEGFKDYAKFYSMEFSISKFSLFDGMKSSDSAVCAKDVKIYMPSTRFCAMIQGNLAVGKEISKIILKKITITGGSIEVLEEKEFTKCVIQQFERKGETSAFTFRYKAYSDSYQDFKSDGIKLGKAATKIDLTTWEVS
jgi:hypothetical protein